jgi:N-acetylneuraminic acid mutarotase
MLCLGRWKKKYFDDIYVLHKDTNKALFWHSQTFRLPQKMAYTTTVQSSQGLICIGGEDQEGYRKEVFSEMESTEGTTSHRIFT